MDNQEPQAEQSPGVASREEVVAATPWLLQVITAVYSDTTSRYLLYVRLALAFVLVLLSCTMMHWAAGLVVATYALFMERELLHREFLQRQLMFLFHEFGGIRGFLGELQKSCEENSGRIDTFNIRLTHYMTQNTLMDTGTQEGN